jgi:glycosyltransferase involved in cell wall biosynthesis
MTAPSTDNAHRSEALRRAEGRMIRVLHVINWLRAGGVETQLMQILRAYDRTRFHMDVCVIGGEIGYLGPEARELGSTILSCAKSTNLLGFSDRFARLIATLHYDVVHSHFETWSGAILRGARLAGVPVRIAHLHSILPWPEDSVFRPAAKLGQAAVLAWGRHWLRRHCTHILAVSEAVLEHRSVRRLHERDKVFLWTGGVDTSRFSPRSEDQFSGANNIIWVGGLLPAKRIDLQLKILKSVLLEVPDAKLTVVGGGKSEPELRLLVGRLGVTDSVNFIGVRHDVPELLRFAKVFLSCSQVEGLPTVMLEAQATGLPVVATDIAPHRECLAKELHPYLFRIDSPAEAAKNIVRILKDSVLRDKLARCGREYVLRKYDSSIQLGLLQDYYSHWSDSGTI